MHSNFLTILRASIFIYSILLIAIKIIAFIVRRNRLILEQESNISDTNILEETETSVQQPINLDIAATNLSVIIILCLCVVVFFLVQNGFHGNNICQYDLIQYWNILFCYLLSISFIAPDLDELFNIKFTNSIIFTNWFKTFELIMLGLYIPITISLMILCW